MQWKSLQRKDWQWKFCRISLLVSFMVWLSLGGSVAAIAGTPYLGYYRDPALHGDQLVFTAEGDLWVTQLGQLTAPITAHRLTSRRIWERHAIISQDGQQVAFVSHYDGSPEAYVMPINGGIPKRVTFEQASIQLQGWTKDNKILYATNNSFGPLRTWRLKTVDPRTLESQDIPLLDANQGSMDEQGGILYFTRFGSDVYGDHLRVYRGGAAGQIWRYQFGSQKEAQRLTPVESGSASHPMYYQGRVYYLSDENGNPNLWSMNPDGSDKTQLTNYKKWPVKSPSLSDGRIVFQLGADLVVYTLTGHQTQTLNLSLMSDEPYRQHRWIHNPLSYATSTTLTPDGERTVITARGKVAIATTDGTRLIEIQTPARSRVKFALMSQDKQWIYAICDASGEEQIWQFAADGSDKMKQITHGGQSIRWSLSESPDGHSLLTDDKDGHLWRVDVKTGKMTKLLSHGPVNVPFGTYRWSDDSRYLAIESELENSGRTAIILYDLKTNRHQQLTTTKYNSFSPSFSPDGQWLYFLSDRSFHSIQVSPWDDRTPEPVLVNRTGVFAVALDKQAKFPFEKFNELLIPSDKKADKQATPDSKDVSAKKTVAGNASEIQAVIDWKGITHRLWQVPVPAGNYTQLSVGEQRLYLLSKEAGDKSDTFHLKTVKYAHRHVRLKTVSDEVEGYALSQQRDSLLVAYADGSYIVPAESYIPDNLRDYQVDTGQWKMVLNPADEWMQMFQDAWLMHRDIFYDPKMRGVDWKAVKAQIQPLVARVTDRYELSDLLGQMTSQLSALHSQVYSGDDTPFAIDIPEAASLGATFKQTTQGVMIERIYRTDPEVPDMAGPLAKPGVDAQEGDLIRAINRRPVKTVADVSQQLRDQVDQQVLLTLSRSGTEHETVVYPVELRENQTLRYQDWVEHNREQVAKQSHDQIGYIYLHAMLREDFDTFAREFYADINKQGLIIDVRNNLGGNVDSWILDILMRRAWMYWKPRHGGSYPNMQQAFRGHIAVIASQLTYSDGETFTAGIKALGLGPVIGMRTSGAGVWLNDTNELTDWGQARAAEFPQYAMNGQWLVEQHGVKPTIEVDNLPYARFKGQDAQLHKAIEYLTQKIKETPIQPLIPTVSAGEQFQASDILSPEK